jgi:hypothetical protein
MRSRRDTNAHRPGPQAGAHAAHAGRQPVEILAQQLAEAKFARVSGDWAGYERARENAVRLTVGHRIEDEVGRFRQVMTACTGSQNWGEDARELMLKRLSNLLTEGIQRGSSAHDVIVEMQRIPRNAAIAMLVTEMRRGDGELCVAYLLSEDGQLADDIRSSFGDDAAQIARGLSDREWARFAVALLTFSPGEPRQDLIVEARKSLRRALSELAST